MKPSNLTEKVKVLNLMQGRNALNDKSERQETTHSTFPQMERFFILLSWEF
jgi:hypothetical protein